MKSSTLRREMEDRKIAQAIISLGLYVDFFQPRPRVFNCDRIRFFHVGIKEHKNLIRTARALSAIECEMRIVGSLSDSQRTILNGMPKKYSETGRISDDQLLKEYENCDMLCFCLRRFWYADC